MSRLILKQSSKIGFFALISRCIAFVREVFLIRFLSIGDTSDIFFTAIRIPNTLRKIFAEGSLSSVLVPAFVSAQHKNGQSGLNRLTTFSFLVIEALMLISCCSLFYFAHEAIHFITPGFAQEKVVQCASLLRILISFILFISSGSIFSAALQSQGNFFIPSLAPSVLNVAYVGSLILCLYFGWSVDAFCYLWILTSVIFFLMHFMAFCRFGFQFMAPDAETYASFKKILVQFLPCFFSVGIVEINHFINTGFCSYLPSGSLTLLRYAFQFINIPIGIITASLVTVLLPHFSKLHLQDPGQLKEHLFEAMKFVVWTTLPICFLLGFFSQEIFKTLFWGDPMAMNKVPLAQSIFLAYLFGLLFFSLNKVFLSIFYALRLTMVPLWSTIAAIAINFTLNRMLMHDFGASGIAFAASMSATVQTIIFMIVIYHYLRLSVAPREWFSFLMRYALQFVVMSSLFFSLFRFVQFLIMRLNFNLNLYVIHINQPFLTQGIGIWLWAGPLSLIYCLALFFSRKKFGIVLHYFDK